MTTGPAALGAVRFCEDFLQGKDAALDMATLVEFLQSFSTEDLVSYARDELGLSANRSREFAEGFRRHAGPATIPVRKETKASTDKLAQDNFPSLAARPGAARKDPVGSTTLRPTASASRPAASASQAATAPAPAPAPTQASGPTDDSASGQGKKKKKFMKANDLLGFSVASGSSLNRSGEVLRP